MNDLMLNGMAAFFLLYFTSLDMTFHKTVLIPNFTLSIRLRTRSNKTYSGKNINFNIFLQLPGISFSMIWCVTVRNGPKCNFCFFDSKIHKRKENINLLPTDRFKNFAKFKQFRCLIFQILWGKMSAIAFLSLGKYQKEQSHEIW